MKYISKGELNRLCEVFDNALTGSGGTERSGICAVLSEVGIEVALLDEEIQIVPEPQLPSDLETYSRETHCGHH